MTLGQRFVAAILVICVSVLPGCGGGSSTGTQSPPPQPSFSISVDPITNASAPLPVSIDYVVQSVPPPNVINVRIVGRNGFSGTVDLTISGLPNGVSVNPTAWSMAAGQAPEVVTITAKSKDGAFAGTSNIQIAGTSGTLSDSVQVAVRTTRYSFKWTPGLLTYHIDRYPDLLHTKCNSSDGYCSWESVEQSVARGIYAWAKHAKLAGITFIEVGPTSHADINIGWRPSYDWLCQIQTDQSICGSRAITDHIGKSGKPWMDAADAIIYFDDGGNSIWTTDKDVDSAFNVESTVLHEFGHVLGLAHYCEPSLPCATLDANAMWPPIMDFQLLKGGQTPQYPAILDLFDADQLPLYGLYAPEIGSMQRQDLQDPTYANDHSAFAYVTNQGSSSISVIRLGDGHSGPPFRLDLSPLAVYGPQGIAHVDDRGKIYVATYESGKLVPLNISGDQVLSNWALDPAHSPVDTGPGANEVAIAPDGSRAYVTNFLANTISVIDLSSYKVVANISDPCLLEPSAAAVTLRGTYVLVTSRANNAVCFVNAQTMLVEDAVSVGSSPEAIAVEPNGLYAYTADAGDGQVSKIDISHRWTCDLRLLCGFADRVWPIKVGSNPLSLLLLFDSGTCTSPDVCYLHHAYVSSFGDGSISVIDLWSSTLVGVIRGLLNPIGMAASPDGSLLYVAEFGANRVREVDTKLNGFALDDTGQEIPPIPVGQQPVGVTISSHPKTAPIDMALSRLQIDGNISVNGSSQFLDTFNDDRLDQFPTNQLWFWQGPTSTDESGMLRFRSDDGAQVVGNVIRDAASTMFDIVAGNGDSAAIAEWPPLFYVTQDGQAYCLGIRNQNPPDLPVREGTQICVALDPNRPPGVNRSVAYAIDSDGQQLGISGPFASGTPVTMRLRVVDSQNRVYPGFALSPYGSSLQFTEFSPGTIFTQDTNFSVFVQSAAELPLISNPLDGQWTGGSAGPQSRVLTGTTKFPFVPPTPPAAPRPASE